MIYLFQPQYFFTIYVFLSNCWFYIDFFFRIHRLTEQRCGQVVESFGYNDHNGRLEETRKNCQRRPTKFIYAPNSQRVSEYAIFGIPIPNGRIFSSFWLFWGKNPCLIFLWNVNIRSSLYWFWSWSPMPIIKIID